MYLMNEVPRCISSHFAIDLRTSPTMVMRWKSINYKVEWFTPALLILRGRGQSCCILYPSSILSSIRDPPASPSRNRRSEVKVWRQITNVEMLERLPLTKPLATVYSTTNRSILYVAAEVPSLRPTSSYDDYVCEDEGCRN